MKDGRFLLEGTLKLSSPAIIGSGNNEITDLDLLLSGDGKPFIPATSFVGVLRHMIGDDDKDFWGYTAERDNKQSDFICSDLTPTGEVKTAIRDGIRIDNKRGIVAFDKEKETGAKFDYQIIERDTEFNLRLEVPYEYKDDKKSVYQRLINTICYLLKNEKVSVGAKTNSGFGRLRLNDARLYDYDFNKKADVLKWLKKEYPEPVAINYNDILKLDKPQFTIEAHLLLKNSFIVRSYTVEPDEPDAVNIKSNGKDIIPGTSLKGAIRARAERILNTLGKPLALLDDLFGYVKEKDTKDAKKGRLLVEETILPDLASEIQTRIKIDRFTGGTIESALFETKPVFADRDQNKKVYIKITINDHKDYEAGLMLLVLKDLFTGDIAVGGEKNVGRGVFEGLEAKICWGNEVAVLKRDDLSGLSRLQPFVDVLNKYKEVDNG